MSPVLIRVRGEHLVRRAPERARVHLSIGVEDEAADLALADLTRTLAVVRGRLDQNGEDVYVDQVRTWSDTGDLGPGSRTRHVAQVDLRADFRDVAVLGQMLPEIAAAGASIGWTEWLLDHDTRRALEAEARREALKEATTRAQDYATALGLGAVRVVLVSDGGLGQGAVPRMALMSQTASPFEEPVPALFHPEDVEVSVQVEVEFLGGE